MHFPVTRLIANLPTNDEENSLGKNFHWIDEKQLAMMLWHPWYSIEYGLTKKKFEADSDQEGRLHQGDRKKFYFIENVKKRRISTMDILDELGFDW